MGSIIECGINFLSYGRAATLVPPEFLAAYEWFQSMEGKVIPRLPRGADAPSIGASIKLAAMRGIHSPNYKELESKGAGKRKYALSVYSAVQRGASASVNAFYSDQDLVMRDDGTWIMDYCEQRTKEGRRSTDRSNDHLMNNLVDGVPVAVMVGQPTGGYKVCGLAYVERYDPSVGMFTLHGPVSAEESGVNFYSGILCGDLTPDEEMILMQADGPDERTRVLVEAVKRERQADFRRRLLRAYEGKCAVTLVDVPEVLQAAHIDPYRGRRSQVVTNGILLRSDLHLLYDSHLITVLPDSFEMRVSESIAHSAYGRLDGKRIRLPGLRDDRPSEVLLDMHAREYYSVQRMLAQN